MSSTPEPASPRRSASRSSAAWRLPELLGGALLLGLVALPIAFSLVYASLYSVGLTGLLAEGFTLEHWAGVLASRETWASLGLSLYVSVVTVGVTTGLALALTFALGPSLARGPVVVALYFPLAIPATVAAFLAFQVLSGGGLLARLLVALGMIERPGEMIALVQDPLALGILLTHVALAVPFFTLLFRELAASERLPELTALAAALGASRWQQLLRVAIPVLLYRSRSNLVLFAIVVFGAYEIPFLLGRQAPQMISVLTLRKFALFDLYAKPQAYALALLYSLLVLALLALVAGWRRREPG